MKLRTKYLFFVALLHLVALVLSFYVFQENKLYFIVSEIFIFISAAIAWSFYKELIAPLRRLMQGIEAIKDRDFNVKFLTTGSPEMGQLINVYNTMIDELRKERTQQEQQHFFLEKLIATSPTGIIILDYDNHIQLVNYKALTIIKLPENKLIGRTMNDINHPIINQVKTLESGESVTINLTGINMYKVQKAQFIDRGFARSFIMIEELTEEIVSAEKKVYSKVIRMMAHEVNNSIGPVNSILHSALNMQQLWQQPSTAMLKEALCTAIMRNENLNVFTRNFANLVKLPEPIKKPISVHQLVHAIAHLMEIRAAEKNIRFQIHLPEQDFIIYADEAQMEQVLVNIVKNAIEAIDEGGIITFIVKDNKLIIADTGQGIDANHQQYIFSPFFSTKKDGQGIGLTLVREVLTNHGFHFTLERNVAALQTEFIIDFSRHN
ncbi:HAMP domain-containing protein [Ilyomonas limi]|uniref:histidine kinase n=2 Tax=Ilyomonas limi TaxID=2575867 RepID=A0A4U3L086_9BACT|nr:HAMP domain-containing protein [Ilyomonas limi]